VYYYYDLQKNHPVWGKINDVITLVEEGITLNDSNQHMFTRYQRIMTELRSRLKSIPKDLVSIPMLDQIAGLVDRIEPKMKHYLQKKDESVLANVEKSFDQVLEFFYKLYAGRIGTSTSVVKESYDAYMKKVSQKENEIQNKLEYNEKELVKLGKELERLDKVVAGYKEKVSSTVTDSKRKAAEELTDLKSSYKNTIAEFKRNYENLKAQMDRDRSSVFHKYDNDYSQMRDRNQENFDSKINDYNKTYDEFVDQLHEKDMKVNEILSIIGNKAMTSDYKAEAAKQDKLSWYLKIGSIFFMLFIVAGAAWVYFDVQVKETIWQINLVRLLATLTVLYPATYLARESTRHRTLSNMLKKKHLELATIDTFISNLPEDERNTIKASLIDKYFGHYSEEDNDKKESEESISPSMVETFVKWVSACQKIIK